MNDKRINPSITPEFHRSLLASIYMRTYIYISWAEANPGLNRINDDMR